jgi:hypothetical protein
MSICFFSKVAAATTLYLLAMPTPAATERPSDMATIAPRALLSHLEPTIIGPTRPVGSSAAGRDQANDGQPAPP